MSVVQNMYISKDLEMTLVKDAAMHDSPSQSISTNTLAFEHALAGHMQGDPPKESTANTQGGKQSETIEFEEDPSLWIPPSSNQSVYKHMLRD